MGHDVFVASSGGDLADHLLKENIVHIGLNLRTKSELSPKLIFAFLRLKGLIKEKNIEIIHAQTRVTQVLSFFLSRALSIPYVTTCHGYFKPKLARKIFGFWGRRVIAISGAVRKHLIEDLKVRQARIKLVYNGVALNPKKDYPINAIKKRLGLSEGPVVGMVARLSPVKGHLYLISAMKHVLSIEPYAQLLIVGDGPYKKVITDFINELKLRDKVHIIPSRAELGEIFSVMDVFVSPSIQEGLGLSILEAQSNLVPCVGFRIGGITDVIEHEVTGLLVEQFDIKALAQAVVRLIRDKYLSRSIAKTAYDLIGEKFSSKIMSEKTINVYKEVLA